MVNGSDPGTDASEVAKDQAFERRARGLLEASAASLDGPTLSRLTRARHAALAELAGARPVWPAWLVPAGGVAAAALAVLVWWAPGRGPGVVVTEETAGTSASPLEDLEIMAGVEDLALFEELEFYAWLDEATGFDADEGGAG